jgi:hypothetical protein
MNKGIKIKPVFILGQSASFLRDDGIGFYDTKDESEQDRKTDEIIGKLKIPLERKTIIRNEKDLAALETSHDAFILFVHTAAKYPYIELVVETGKPIIIAGEEGAPGDALDAYESLARHENVAVAFDYETIRRKVKIIRTAWSVKNARICLFDSGKRTVEGSPWYSNPLLNGMLKALPVDIDRFSTIYRNVNGKEAENLANSWMDEARVDGPSTEDIARSAAVYLAMRRTIEEMKADAAYVLWCSQFNELIDGKMCFAVTKLNDTGHLTGCWRGENMLPMLILHSLSEKAVFFGEVHTFRDSILAVRHCAVPQSISGMPFVLKPWGDRKGTVTGYCELPEGEVTIVNAGIGDKMIALNGRVFDTKDIGGANCRTTVYVRVEDPEAVRRFCGREIAMAYGDFVSDVEAVGNMLNIETNR